MAGTYELENPDFELGNVGWTIESGGFEITQGEGPGYSGQWHALCRPEGTAVMSNNARIPVAPGTNLSMQGYISTTRGDDSGRIVARFFDASGVSLGQGVQGSLVKGTGGYRASRISTIVPSSAATVTFVFEIYKRTRSFAAADTASIQYTANRTVTLVAPTEGQEFTEEQLIPLRVEVSGTAPPITSVSYLLDGVEEQVVTSAPYGVNLGPLEAGSYTVQARLNLANNTTVFSSVVNFTVAAIPVPPTLREYRASNSYTYLVGQNFIGLGEALPPTARVLGMEVLVDYGMEVRVRSKDLSVTNPADSNYDVAFSVVTAGLVEAVLLRNDGGSYTQIGSAMSQTVPIDRTEFTITENGVSEEKRWTVLEGGEGEVVIGGEDDLFSIPPEFGSTFLNYGVGIRFTPVLGSIPEYADAGDASYRFKVNSFKVRVYFDAGSVEYYFASPDKDEVLKGILTAYYVYTGNFKTSDAAGVLQITSELEQMEGTQRWIGSDWTIHSSYPPTDINQIGFVDEVDMAGVGMKYNALPTQAQILDNRSRYEIKTENFYGSEELNSMYGVHGLARAFAYNGDFFYKIYTQADPEKDSPRHVANHHGHLALGYTGGRVDISVAGEPYNFNGVDGASSWAFGDKVVGLLPLSGTILGVFGSKSVWGISGTTVDNFATQVISPNMGAVEYTITDMGFPVYANSYGIYTLNQTQQYGDYLGQPMSQDISPWLRPRLIRKLTSDKEVVCAFPVRSKNQYRLCFSDGYVTSMTLNGQQTPTFSFQKYFYTPEGEWEAPSDMYEYPSIVPAAVSSELDVTGEERIHIANIEEVSLPITSSLKFAVAAVQWSA